MERLVCGREECLHNATGSCLAMRISVVGKRGSAVCQSFCKPDPSRDLMAEFAEEFVPGAGPARPTRVDCTKRDCVYCDSGRCVAELLEITSVRRNAVCGSYFPAGSSGFR